MSSEAVRKYARAVYHLRKDHKFCVYCGHVPAEPGIVFCSECKMKKRKQGLEYYYNLPEEKKQELYARVSSRQRDRKAKGLCVRCGEPVEKTTLCEKHREEARLYQREYQKRKTLKELEVKND